MLLEFFLVHFSVGTPLAIYGEQGRHPATRKWGHVNQSETLMCHWNIDFSCSHFELLWSQLSLLCLQCEICSIGRIVDTAKDSGKGSKSSISAALRDVKLANVADRGSS